jgi:hypothetical protein
MNNKTWYDSQNYIAIHNKKKCVNPQLNQSNYIKYEYPKSILKKSKKPKSPVYNETCCDSCSIL